MQLPQGFPDNPRNAEAVHTLIDRVRKLEPSAKARLAVMLEEEMDLPYLDAMERQYADFFRKVAPDNATMLRGRFVEALDRQRIYLVGLVRQALTEGCNGLQNSSSDMQNDSGD